MEKTPKQITTDLCGAEAEYIYAKTRLAEIPLTNRDARTRTLALGQRAIAEITNLTYQAGTGISGI